MIKLVIFDLDNTLLDRDLSFRGFAEWVYITFLVEDENKEEIIKGMIRVDEQGYGSKWKVWSYINQNAKWKKRLSAEEYHECFLEHMANFSEVMDGTHSILQRLLDDGYNLGMITNGKTIGQNRKIDALNIRKYFSHIIISEEVGIKKPEKEIFKMILDKYSIEPQQSVYIGDSPQNDILGASSAGMHAIWMSYRKNTWDNQIVVDKYYEIKTLKSILPIIRENL